MSNPVGFPQKFHIALIVVVLVCIFSIVIFWSYSTCDDYQQNRNKIRIEYSITDEDLMKFGGLDGYFTVKIENRSYIEEANMSKITILSMEKMIEGGAWYWSNVSFKNYDLVQVSIDYILRVPVMKELDEEHSIIVYQTRYIRLYQNSFTLNENLRNENYWLIDLEWGE